MVNNSRNPIFNDDHHISLSGFDIDALVKKGAFLVFEVMVEEPENAMLGMFRIPIKTLIDQNEHEFTKGYLSTDEGSTIDENVFIDVQVTLI